MNSEEIIKFLNEQEKALKQKPKFFLHYNPETLRIVNFRNYLESKDELPYIELTEEQLGVPLKNFDVIDYFVSPDKKKIEKIVDEGVTVSKIDDLIYEIPKVVSDKRLTYKDKQFDLMIEQNNTLREFKIKLSKPIKERFRFQARSAQEMSVYVTAMNDPNILYKTLKFTFSNIIENEYFTITFGDFGGQEVNIYASKYFDNYLHVDIRDDK